MPRATLEISLSAIVANWRLLQHRHAKKSSAAVVKADAYGLGMVSVAKALHSAGCGIFFVATLEEGIVLRKALIGVPIYIFHGVGKGEENEFTAHDLRPVLNSSAQIERWKTIGKPAALHIDTGMTRLGLSESEIAQIADKASLIKECGIELLMSHLVNGAEPESPLNEQQWRRFEAAKAHFPGIAYSLANSAAHFFDPKFHYDLGRPGCALYGITPFDQQPNPMQPVATLSAPILQLRQIDRDGTIGYGATTPVTKGMRTATVACGYADGIFRSASHQLNAWAGDIECRMLGRVSMDMTCYDVTQVPELQLQTLERLTLIGGPQPVDKVAEICDTIGYEIFTRLGNRIERQYL